MAESVFCTGQGHLKILQEDLRKLSCSTYMYSGFTHYDVMAGKVLEAQ